MVRSMASAMVLPVHVRWWSMLLQEQQEYFFIVMVYKFSTKLSLYLGKRRLRFFMTALAQLLNEKTFYGLISGFCIACFSAVLKAPFRISFRKVCGYGGKKMFIRYVRCSINIKCLCPWHPVFCLNARSSQRRYSPQSSRERSFSTRQSILS